MGKLTLRADDVARAIVAAARETGADPEAVAKGDRDPFGSDLDDLPAGRDRFCNSRARMYAGFALVHIFEDYARPDIARMIGVSRKSVGAYFASADARGGLRMPWVSAEAFARVVAAVERDLPVEETESPAARIEPPKRGSAVNVSVDNPSPPRRPAPRVIDDDDGDGGAVFDAGQFRERRPAEPHYRGKADIMRVLARAAANTAKLQKGDDDGNG